MYNLGGVCGLYGSHGETAIALRGGIVKGSLVDCYRCKVGHANLPGLVVSYCIDGIRENGSISKWH